MNKIFFIFLLMLLTPMISAADTAITIQTLPEHDVDVSVLKPVEGYSLIESFHKPSDSNGTLSITFSTTESEFNVRVWLKKDNTIIVYKKFEENYPVGEPLTLEVYPDWYLKQKEIEASMKKVDETQTTTGETTSQEEETTNGSVTEENTEEQEEKQENLTTKTEGKNSSALNGITGFFTSIKSGISKKIIYSVIAFVSVIALFSVSFLVIRRIRNSKPKEVKGIKVKKLSDKIKEKKQEQEKSDADLIADYEQRIKEAEEQIEKIKNKTNDSERRKKIAEVKKKLIADEQELMKLRGEK